MNVNILEVNEITGTHQVIAELDLASIPTANDKIVVEISNTGYVFKVVETHYSANKAADVFVTRIDMLNAYMKSRFTRKLMPLHNVY